MGNEVEEFKKEILNLKIQLQTANDKIIEYAKTNNQLLKEFQFQKESTQNTVLKEKELQTKVATWEKVVDEMAHSIITDVFAALTNLSNIQDNSYANRAIHNVNRIRDIANLIMWDLNKSRLPVATASVKVDIKELVETQIASIKDGIDSLRLSYREHKKLLSQLVIPIIKQNDCSIQIDDNIEPGLELIIKDLLRNAFQNTDEENPKISIEISSNENMITLQITNNRIISDKELIWFNEDIDSDEIQMSKSSKVGLRLVKRWFKNLSIKGKFSINTEINQTTIVLSIPRVIKYAKEKI